MGDETHEMDWLVAFTSDSDERAEWGFEKLLVRTRPMLNAHLRTVLTRTEDREDVISTVVERLWRARRRFVPLGMAAWWQFVKRTADRCAMDQLSANGRVGLMELPELQEIPDSELPVIDSLLASLQDRATLYRLADEVWLGEQAIDHHRRLLAAKLFYIDGLAWDRVALIVSGGPPDRKSVTRQALDQVFSDPTMIRYVAYAVLYFNNPAITALILGLDTADLDAIERATWGARNGEPPAGWTWDETAVILRRYLKIMLLDQIAAIPECSFEKEDLRDLFDRCRQRFPFVARIDALLSRLEHLPDAAQLLTHRRLWSRLVFQYHASDELPHRDIHERVAPPAERVGFTLTLGMLNVWLSNGRLLEKLVKRNAEEGAYAE
jgi:DNA-directed RNA polymerase specialized sigma24 family protein